MCGNGFAPFNLRPYGKGGAAICFKCAFATPEAKAQTESAMNAKMDEIETSGFTVLLEPTGPVPLTTGKS